MRTRIGTQLIAGAGAVSALVIGVMAFVLIRAHTGALLKERTRSASQLWPERTSAASLTSRGPRSSAPSMASFSRAEAVSTSSGGFEQGGPLEDLRAPNKTRAGRAGSAGRAWEGRRQRLRLCEA